MFIENDYAKCESWLQMTKVRNDHTSSRVPRSPFLPNVDTARYSFHDWVFRARLRSEEQTSIWGLSKQGKTCKMCGLSVHSKCELKVRNPMACTGLVADLGVRCLLTAKKREVDVCQSFLGKERHYHVRRPKVLLLCLHFLRFLIPVFATVSSLAQPRSPSSFVSSLASKKSHEESYPPARVLFDFPATSKFELDVSGTFMHDRH